ncbi:MAG: thiol oxidoreductase [Hyphomicrobiaceae bacterium]|nr:thiol oxidoreductase [Hyphomicrobiaceae bacterium]
MRAHVGEAIFKARWKPAPNVSEGIDGLGPLYNAASCFACHGDSGGDRVALVLRLSDSVYGRQLQDRAVPGIEAEGRLEVAYVTETRVLGDGQTVELRKPHPAIAEPAYGPLSADARVSLRRPPPLAGVGLIATIADSDIRAGADPDDRDGDGISGRAGEVADPATGQTVLARFGWKASVATLAQQTSEALSVDMGLSSAALPRPAGDCTAAQSKCLSAPHGDTPGSGGAEVSEEEIALLVAYLVSLPPPVSLADAGADEERQRGRALFGGLGCTACHRPGFQAGASSDHEPVRPEVRLHSDLLLHDMGEELADDRPEGSASGREWRTQPLWGLSERIKEIDGGAITGLLHDGRARTIEEAILWHGGEAERASGGYARLASGDRAALLAYLSGL